MVLQEGGVQGQDEGTVAFFVGWGVVGAGLLHMLDYPEQVLHKSDPKLILESSQLPHTLGNKIPKEPNNILHKILIRIDTDIS